MQKVLVLFGGKSSEHDVSIMSIKSFDENYDKELFLVDYVYITQDGVWKKVIDVNDLSSFSIVDNFSIVKNYDVVFPLIHGSYGEDGRLQGLLEMYDVKYVGCNTLTSAICMDKDYTKKILSSINIPVVDGICVYKNYDLSDIKTQVLKLGYPCFIKPCNAGSSFGTKKVSCEEDLKSSLDYAFSYDDKVLIEKFIDAREVEVAVLGNNDNLTLAGPGEIIINKDYYDYESKYFDDSTSIVVCELENVVKDLIFNYAELSYKVLGCRALSRIDFFIDKNDGKVYLNEINTMPGFTKLSMYPFLIRSLGYSYKDLITKLIYLALED